MNSRASSQRALESFVGEIAEEFIARLGRGEQPRIEDYVAQHPQAADAIRRVLSALQAVRALSSGSAGTTDSDETDGRLKGHLGDYRIIREVGRRGDGCGL